MICAATDFEAEFGIFLKASVRIIGVVYIPMLDMTNPILSGTLYSANIEVATEGSVCGMITDATANPEVSCAGEIARSVSFVRTCDAQPCEMGVCSLGIMSDCVCDDTLFAEDAMDSELYQDVELFEHHDFILPPGSGS
jgi:hypothetical protein